MRYNVLALAFAALSAGAAAESSNLTAAQATTLLENIIDSLQTAGDLRTSLQKATPTFTEQNAATPYQSLADSFNNTLSLLPDPSGDVNIGSATAAQAAAICALVPKFVSAGTYATDTLTSLPGFQDGGNEPARESAINLGLNLDTLGEALNSFHWGFINSGAATTCDQATQNDFYTVPNLLTAAGDAILY
ncbi:hypothetical protein V8C35DRAFT_119605 [Trichoderma chlorosporum]